MGDEEVCLGDGGICEDLGVYVGDVGYMDNMYMEGNGWCQSQVWLKPPFFFPRWGLEGLTSTHRTVLRQDCIAWGTWYS